MKGENQVAMNNDSSRGKRTGNQRGGDRCEVRESLSAVFRSDRGVEGRGEGAKKVRLLLLLLRLDLVTLAVGLDEEGDEEEGERNEV